MVVTYLSSLSSTDYCDSYWLSVPIRMTIRTSHSVVAGPVAVGRAVRQGESCTDPMLGGRGESGWIVDIWDR
jgi:hypothetical protein